MTTRHGKPARTTTTLRTVALSFVRTPTAALLLLAVLAATLRRAAQGPPRWADVAVLTAIVTLHPFAEWAVHRLLLHGQPRRWGRLTLDPLMARAHRAHHAAPRDRRHLMTPPRVVLELVVLAGLVTSALPEPLDGTALAGILALALGAEWHHSLIHSDYQPRSAWLRRLAKRHRLHHHRNEKYWFGLTSSLADQALGTNPDPAATPVSPTTRTLPGVPRRPQRTWSPRPGDHAAGRTGPSRGLDRGQREHVGAGRGDVHSQQCV